MLTSVEDALAARRRTLATDEKITATDALCLAIDEANGIWVSTPNAWFVPEPPVHDCKQHFGFYEDGMLGVHEYLKWPQAFYRPDLHTIAAPVNPFFSVFIDKEIEKYGCEAYVSTPDVSDVDVLFDDLRIPWENLSELTDIEILDFDAEPRICRIRRSVLSPWGAAMREAQHKAEEVAHECIADVLNPSDDEQKRKAAVSQYLYNRTNINKLQRVFELLVTHTSPPFELIMYHREFQRALLEIRAWIVWYKVVRPRLLSPDFHRPFPVLPIRGVFTTNPTLVQDFFRVGVPVWYIRKAGSLTTDVFVNRVKGFTSSASFMSRRRLLPNNTAAPSYLESPFAASYTAEEARKDLEKFSILNKPVLRPLREYGPQVELELKDAVASRAMETYEAPGKYPFGSRLTLLIM